VSPVRLKIKGVNEVKDKLRAAQRNLSDMESLWDKVTELMIEIETELFDSEGATAIPVWPPLAASTIERKTRQGLPLVPMIATGALEESLTSKIAGEVSQGRSTLGTFTENVFSWGTDVLYAGYHQDPSFSPEHTDINNPPIRNVVNVTPDLLSRLDETIEDWMGESLREAGFAT
jgi:phage gpG-like protein